MDVELPREPGAPRRRRSRTVHGSREEAERILAELRGGLSGAPTVALNVRLTLPLIAALRRAATIDGVSVTEEVQIALLAHFDLGGRED